MDEMLKRRFVFGWKIIVYLFLAGMGGGAAAVGAAFHLIHPGAEIVTMAAVMVGAPLVLLGCALLFTDLGLPGAAFRAISRPHKAWISRGSIILTIFIASRRNLFRIVDLAFPGVERVFLLSQCAECLIWDLWRPDGDLHGFSFRYDAIHSLLVDTHSSAALPCLGCFNRRFCPDSNPSSLGSSKQPFCRNAEPV